MTSRGTLTASYYSQRHGGGSRFMIAVCSSSVTVPTNGCDSLNR